MPASPSPEHDFAGLTRFIAEEKARGRELTMPVTSGGEDDKGWYWMSAENSQLFRPALQKQLMPLRQG